MSKKKVKDGKADVKKAGVKSKGPKAPMPKVGEAKPKETKPVPVKANGRTQKKADMPAAQGAADKQPVVKKPVDLTPLKEAVKQAEKELEAARKEYNEMQKKAQEDFLKAKRDFQDALFPYRDACRKAGVACEFIGGRSPNVADRVSFLVEKVDKGIKIVIKGRPETEEVIPFEALKKQGVTKTAYSYTEEHIGPKEEIGNKGGGLSNRLRAVYNS